MKTKGGSLCRNSVRFVQIRNPILKTLLRRSFVHQVSLKHDWLPPMINVHTRTFLFHLGSVMVVGRLDVLFLSDARPPCHSHMYKCCEIDDQHLVEVS
jgi:hypothetical protein